MSDNRDREILHVDANSFFASVSIALHPEYAGLPLAVAGNPEKRHGIILAKSEEAKKFGVKTAETIWQARKKCPGLVCVPPEYDEYVRYSERLHAIYMDYTDRVESFGLDECWLDCTESRNLFGRGREIAETIRSRVKREIGITVSIGVSFSKIFAKLGSDYKKPDAVTVFDRSNYRDTVWRLPVAEMLMIGGKTALALNKLGIRTIGDLATADPGLLRAKFGIIGPKLRDGANGIDDEAVKEYYYKRTPESIGKGTTMPVSIDSEEEILAVVTGITDVIAARLRRHNLTSGGVRLYIKFDDLSGRSRQCVTPYHTSNSGRLAKSAMKLLGEIYDYDRKIRAVTVTAFNLEKESERQMSMFDYNEERNEKLDGAIDEIRRKYGFDIVSTGIVKAHGNLCGGLIDTDFIPFNKAEILDSPTDD